MRFILSKLINALRYLFKNTAVHNLRLTSALYDMYARFTSNSLSIKDGITQITFNGMSLEMNTDSLGIEPTLIDGTWEHRELELLAARIPFLDCFIDIGANVGIYTLSVISNPDFKGSVFAFEPSHETNLILKRNILKHDSQKCVTTIEKAVADEPGYIEIVNLDIPAAVTIAKRETLSNLRISKKQIEVTTLDSLLNGNNYKNSKIFIKVDVEGAEPLVVLGGKRLIQEHRPDLLLEISRANSEKIGCDWEQAAVFLDEIYTDLIIVGPRGVKRADSVYSAIMNLAKSKGIHSLFFRGNI